MDHAEEPHNRPDDANHIQLADVHMEFDGRVVFDSLSCSFPRGRISMVLGGSGQGKSTLLRVIAGLVQPLRGSVLVAGTDLSRPDAARLREVRARIGMLFQGGALLDSLTVFDNLAFPLREHGGVEEAEIARRVRDRLDAVGLGDVEALLPGQLSGGMLRRVALARAIMLEPEILLCDEPFSGLDPVSVKRIEGLLSRINRRLNITIVVVSHHIASTMRLADQVSLMLPGRIVHGRAEELRDSADPEVRAFFDEQNLEADFESEGLNS